VVDRYRQVENLIGQEPPLGADAGVAGQMGRLCRAAGKALRASGAGLTVMADGGLRAVSAASDDAAGALEELQFTVGEGPCIDAYELQRPVLIPDVNDAAMTRWPAYAPAVYAGGVRAVFAFPLQIGAARLGMLDLFRAEPGMLSGDELALALTFAEVAVGTLVDGQDHSRGGVMEGWLDDSLGSRAELYQAQGMVMVQLRVHLTEAMARMRAYAFARDLRLGDVAAGVVAGRIRFDQDAS
jgi:GAF domain-containing protein/ANTAR domain-containing protein